MKTKILFIILAVFFISGCSAYNELDDLSICTAMAIDLEDNNYKVTYMIANSKKSNASSKEGEAKTILYDGIGKNLSEAIDNIALISPKALYIGHLSIIVISEEVAKKGMINIMDYLLRNSQSRKKFDLVLSQNNKARDTLQILSPLESFPSRNILSNLKSSNLYQSISLKVQYNDFLEVILDKGINPVLSSISVIGDIEEGGKSDSLDQTVIPANLIVNSLGIFKKDKLLKFSNFDETIGINFINNKIKKSIISIPCDNNYIVFEVIKSLTKKDINFNKDKITGKISINTSLSIGEVNCKINLEDIKVVEDLKLKVKQKIEDLVDKAIKIAKDNQTDIFGFGSIIYKNYNNKWSKYEKNWDNFYFPNLNILKNINVKIINSGSLKRSLKEVE
ncbi:MAG: Ger(x)C family spore germination protein [Bacilli bacterium]